MPSVLWRCWLGDRKGIQPVKNWVVGCRHGYLSGARCRVAYSPADATATHRLFASVKSKLVLPLWYWLTRVVPDKGPLNGCVCVCIICSKLLTVGKYEWVRHYSRIPWADFDNILRKSTSGIPQNKTDSLDFKGDTFQVYKNDYKSTASWSRMPLPRRTHAQTNGQTKYMMLLSPSIGWTEA